MKKLKKKVLGSICLLIVAAMTLVAHALPSSNALATSSITDTIVVTVYDKYASVTFNNPSPNEVVTDPYIDFDYDYSSTRKIYFTLTYNGDIIDEWQEDGLDYLTPGHGDHTSDLSEYGEYVLSWLAVGAAPGLESEGSFSFRKHATKVVYIGTNSKNEPVFDVYFNNNVEAMDFQIYTENGTPLFNPILKYPLTDTRYSQVSPTGTTEMVEQTSIYSKRIRVVIPMPSSAVTGDYVIGVTGYDSEGERIGNKYYLDSESIDTFHYVMPESPDVPNTGSFSTPLNIARSDFLITGLLIFFSAAIGALYILNKKNR